MKTPAEVNEAKALMTEAVDWSVMKWLKEKKRVRKIADKANDALWAMQKEVKSRWGDDLKAAYDDLAKQEREHAHRQREAPPRVGQPRSSEFALARKVKEADDEAYRAHMDAEATFDKAEKILSTSMAREGCRKAIHSWELYEKAIVVAEAGIQSKN
jgi:hypothetical protein